MTTGATPFLTRWFAHLDSDEPDRVLDLISDDFAMSILFASAPGAAVEFVGDRDGLVAYLAQRARSTFVHVILQGTQEAGIEQVLGKTTLDGAFAASFNATAQVVDGRLRRLLIARTPALTFD
ncbi:hypothetical protein RDV89_09285 [Nocardioides zeae]|uniref:SnoaL-like domain-containing protein n=1 Tax=Nocardioides imazamoxiresistens TaxID=3231893 RepID=A0ABU3PVK5_9ACTN|nr:hypothetical protein [Nocardioides zeae]MDT9593258.1 hypothetical protein [Nocardioides zeae]